MDTPQSESATGPFIPRGVVTRCGEMLGGGIGSPDREVSDVVVTSQPHLAVATWPRSEQPRIAKQVA